MECEGSENGCNQLDETDQPEPKRKRKSEAFLQLPNSSTIGFDIDLIEELQAAYEILQTIMKISKIEAFLVKPNSDLYGMSSYYSVVKKPMWLNEVHRKLMDREYKGIKEVIADIKLLLENCYRFWGPSHRVTKKGLHIEHKLEQKLEELPTALKTKCLTEEPCEIIVETETNADDNLQEPLENGYENKLYENDYNCYSSYKGFHSKILNKVLKSEQDELYSEESCEEQKKKEQDMITWEEDYLVDEETRRLIKHMPELAQIGQFLRLTSAVLNVEEITQYEVERMLLMPRESTSLATLMTSMLSRAILRSNLDVTPIMPYEVWTAKLRKKIEDWLKIYYKTDAINAFNINGIEPYFWEVISLVNPLEEKRFHEISFYERVWILKSLCDNLLHMNKTIQDAIIDESRAGEYRAIEFGSGPTRIYYFGLEFFPEIRVYKQRKVLQKVWKNCKLNGECNKLTRVNIVPKWNEIENRMEFQPNPNFFSIEADNVDSLITLIEQLKLKGYDQLTSNLTNYLNKAKKHKYRLEGLEALYRQWHEYQNRPPEYFTNLLNLWLSTEGPVYPSKEEEGGFPILGKRRSTTKTNMFFTDKSIETSEESSEEFIESDVSDWEEEAARRRSRKKKNLKEIKRKRSKSNFQEESISNNDLMKMIIEEPKLETKTNYEELRALLNHAQPPPPSSPEQTTAIPASSKHRINVIPIVEVKKEAEDDVISISSDEEDVKPILSSLPPPPTETVPVAPTNPLSQPPPPPSLAPAPIPGPIYRPTPVPPPQPPPPPPSIQQPPPQPPPAVTAHRIPTSNNNNNNNNNVISPYTKIGSSVVLFKVSAQPPPPEVSVRVPQPIIEPGPAVIMPKPIQEVVKTPRKKPVPMPIQEPPPPHSPGTSKISPNRTPSNRQRWLQQQQGTPPPNTGRSPLLRQRSPLTPGMVPSQMQSNMNMIRPGQRLTTNTGAQRNLFHQPNEVDSTSPTIEGVLHIGLKADNSYGYHLRLPDGGIIDMSREEIELLRQKNNGNLPSIVRVPLNRNSRRVIF